MHTLAWLLIAIGLMTIGAETASGDKLTLHTRKRSAAKDNTAEKVTEAVVHWEARKTALLLCDMWDNHWCKSAARRVGELAPVMNEVVKAARKQGVFIIHAPSDTLEYYQETPQRLLAQNAPHISPPADLANWKKIDLAKEAALPIDDSDGGCDDATPCPQGKAWSKQHSALEIAPEDAITDSGVEVYNLLQQRGIQNAIIMGVHTNMCVLGRSFGIRSLVGAGINIVLMRDMTDTMYNPKMRPFVSHFRGTELVIEHIETWWCPTITSTDFLHRPAFRFRSDQDTQ
jgi:nicotinamidase-related amidase